MSVILPPRHAVFGGKWWTEWQTYNQQQTSQQTWYGSLQLSYFDTFTGTNLVWWTLGGLNENITQWTSLYTGWYTQTYGTEPHYTQTYWYTNWNTHQTGSWAP